MAAPTYQPPIMITPDICADPVQLARALQQNLDHLAGGTAGVSFQVSELDESRPTLEQTEEVAQNLADEAADSVSINVEQELADSGVGAPDGEIPTSSPTPDVDGGFRGLHILWDTQANTSPMTYEIHYSTDDFASIDILAAEIQLPGAAGGRGYFFISDLDPTVTYQVRIVAKDADGSAPVGTSAAGTPRKTVAEDITDATIDLATKVSGLLPNANLDQITDPALLIDGIITEAKLAGNFDAGSILAAETIVGSLIAADAIVGDHIAANEILADHIAANAITASELAADSVIAAKILAGEIGTPHLAAGAVTAEKINVANLAAIDADLGTVTAGTIDGLLITAPTFRSHAPVNDDTRIEIQGATDYDTIKWIYRDGGGVDNTMVEMVGLDSGGGIEADGTFYIQTTGDRLFLNALGDNIELVATAPGVISMLAPTISIEGLLVSHNSITVGSASTGADTIGKVDFSCTVLDTNAGTPPSNHARQYFHRRTGNPNQLKVRFPNGVMKVLADDS